MKPRIFISAVSGEFKTTRRNTRDWLERLGYEPVTQEIFGTESGDLRGVLREKIDSCQGLLQIVGDAYGFEPPTPDEEFGRVSYTQYEFLYARKTGKKTWLVYAQEQCHRDVPLDELDLPKSGDEAQRIASQAERRSLQAAYRSMLDASGHVRYRAENDLRLQLIVEQLRDHLAEMREAFLAWQTSVDRKLDEIRQLVEPDLDSIRRSLQRTIEATHKKELEEVEKLSSWRDREAARQSAKSRRDERMSRVDEFLDSITSAIDAGEASPDFLELTRIVQEEGVEEALTFIEHRKPELLEQAERQLRDAVGTVQKSLTPIVQKARLHLTRGEYDEAIADCESVLALLPDWAEPLRVHWQALSGRGELAFHRVSPSAASADFAGAVAVAERLSTALPGDALARRMWALSLRQAGDVEMRSGNVGGAQERYLKSLAIVEPLAKAVPIDERFEEDYAEVLDRLGDVVKSLAEVDKNFVLLQMAGSRYSSAMEIRNRRVQAAPSDIEAKRAFAISCKKLGDLFDLMGGADAVDVTRAHYSLALELAEEVAKSAPADPFAQREVAGLLDRLGQIELKAGNLDVALDRHLAAVAIAEKMANADSSNGLAQRDLATSCVSIAAVALKSGDRHAARKRLERALEIDRRLATQEPNDPGTQRSLAKCLYRLGELEELQVTSPQPRSIFSALANMLKGDSAERLTHLREARNRFEEARAVIAEMEARGGAAMVDKQLALLIEQRIAQVRDAEESERSPL